MKKMVIVLLLSMAGSVSAQYWQVIPDTPSVSGIAKLRGYMYMGSTTTTLAVKISTGNATGLKGLVISSRACVYDLFSLSDTITGNSHYLKTEGGGLQVFSADHLTLNPYSGKDMFVNGQDTFFDGTGSFNVDVGSANFYGGIGIRDNIINMDNDSTGAGYETRIRFRNTASTIEQGDIGLYGSAGRASPYIASAISSDYVLLQPQGGNVGIGKTAPGAILDVNGNITSTSNTVNGDSLLLGRVMSNNSITCSSLAVYGNVWNQGSAYRMHIDTIVWANGAISTGPSGGAVTITEYMRYSSTSPFLGNGYIMSNLSIQTTNQITCSSQTVNGDSLMLGRVMSNNSITGSSISTPGNSYLTGNVYTDGSIVKGGVAEADIDIRSAGSQIGATDMYVHEQLMRNSGDYDGIAFGHLNSGGGFIAGRTAATGQSLSLWTFNGAAWGDRFHLAKEGLVGINTVSAVAMLDVNGTGSFAGIITSSATNAVGSIDSIELYDSNSNGNGIHIHNATTGSTDTDGAKMKISSPGDFYLYTNENRSLYLGTNGRTDDLTINNASKISIRELYSGGNITSTSCVTASSITAETSLNVGTVAVVTGGRIQLAGPAAFCTSPFYTNTAVSVSCMLSDYLLQVASNTSSATGNNPCFIVSSSGSVGINALPGTEYSLKVRPQKGATASTVAIECVANQISSLQMGDTADLDRNQIISNNATSGRAIAIDVDTLRSVIVGSATIAFMQIPAFSSTTATGATTCTLGTNSPSTSTTPDTWVRVYVTGVGYCYMPVWKE